jgi:ketol-acid reductoisomerase
MFHAINQREQQHPIEVVGRQLRELMPFIRRPDYSGQSAGERVQAARSESK